MQAPECPLEGGLSFIPSPTSCEQFYICFNGIQMSASCAPGMHWNSVRNLCDFPENARCQVAMNFLIGIRQRKKLISLYF